MSRITLVIGWTLLISLCGLTQAEKPNGNRLTYLDEPCNPYYVHRDFPKLTTPMWVGEEEVEAVVILGIDDMRGHEKWETYLRPILNRLKQIDGRAPVSIMTCTIDPKHPHLQQWLEEGLSLEIHTVDHPCPLLGGMKAKGVKEQGLGVGGQGSAKTNADDAATLNSQPSALSYSKDTYDRCVDLLNEVPNNKPVCFRMPCCDSLNTLSPRFFTEIFAKTTAKGHFLQADSSVFNVFTSDDLTLPRDRVLDADGKFKFKKYIPADRFFANTIENYPYPYVIDRLCWEFPCVTPSDWSAQQLHKPHNPQTVADWKAALDCTVIKQGVFCLVFHPHNWIKPEQINELIDHAVTKHGKKIKFLTFKEAVERLNKNVLGGQTLRTSKGGDNGVRLFDLEGDGFVDCVIGNQTEQVRRWNEMTKEWVSGVLPCDHIGDEFGRKIVNLPKPSIGVFDKAGMASVINLDETSPKYQGVASNEEHPKYGPHGRRGEWLFQNGTFQRVKLMSSISVWVETHATKWGTIVEEAYGRRFFSRDLDRDGVCEILQLMPRKSVRTATLLFDIALQPMPMRSIVSRWSEEELRWQKLSWGLPFDPFFDSDQVGDPGLRFIDLNEDGHDDIVFSNHERYGIWLWESMKTGWSREVLSAQRGDKPAEHELPPIVRADGSNNGFWVHSRQLVWMNEDTAKSKDLVERRSFADLLARRLDAPVRPDGASTPEGKKSSNEKKTEGWTAEGGHPTNESDGPRSPEESLKLMQVKPGYRVELVAAEPLVRDPVAFDWGPDGKLWVAEMADYPLGVPNGELDTENTEGTEKSKSEPQPSVKSASSVSKIFDFKKGGGRVRFLEDTDGDGKYDKSTVFLDKLNFPNGVMPWRDGVLISAAPDVLFARDTNGDGKADEVKVLLTGFGEGNQQHRVNGFSWGLDNMVHCANGDSGGQIKVVSTVGWVESSRPTKPDDAKPKNEKPKDGGSRGSTHPTNYIGKVIDIRGRDFRWNPDTGELDPTSGQTQYGRNRDDFGNWFGNNNANPIYHFVLDDYYTRRNPHVAPPDPKKQVSITPGPSPVFPISRTLARFNDFAMANRFTSANSAMVYRDELLFRQGLRAEGQGEDKNARPSPLSPQPSAISHVFISEPVHNLVHHEIMTADGVTFTSRRADDEQQSEFLASRDNWFRPTQIKTGPDGALYIADMYRQVIEHPQYIPPALQEKLDLRAGHDKGRIYRVVPVEHAARVRTWKPPMGTFSSLVLALSSPNGWERDMAHRMLLWRLQEAPSPAVVQDLRTVIAAAPSPLGRLHALAVLDALRLLEWADITSLLRYDDHPAVRRRALQAFDNYHGEIEVPLPEQIMLSATDPDPFVRLQFAYTAGDPRLHPGRIFGREIANELGKLLYRERDDKYFVAAAMSSIHAQNVASVVANVFESAGKEPLPPQLASTLLNLAAALGNDEALLSLIEYVLRGVATTEAQPVMLAQMLETLDRRGTSLGKLKGIAPQRLARAEQQLAERIDAARTEIANFKSQIPDLKSEISNLKSDMVITLLPLIGRMADQRGDDAKLVGSLLVPQTPVPLQAAAVATLARINHADSAAALLSGWRTFTPALRTQVLDALLSRTAWTDKLLDALEVESIAPSDIDAARRQRLVAHSNEAIRSRAVKLLEVSANADRQKIVAEFAAKLKDSNIVGEATRGAEVFKKRCATCHKLKDIGTSVGADLVSLTDKSTTALLTAILDPNKAVEAKFLAYAAVNKQGQLFSGMIAAETGNSITLMAADGKQHTLLRADLDEFISSNKSFMPEGLEKDVSPSELADVIAFVQSSGPSPKKFDGNQPEAVNSDANGGLRLLATNAEVYGKTLVFEPQFKNLGYWGSVDDRAVWTIRVAKPGKFSIRLNYACDNNTAGNEVVFEVAGQSVKAKIVGTGSWENYQTAILGELTLPAGEHRLTIRAAETLKNHLMDLKELRLAPE